VGIRPGPERRGEEEYPGPGSGPDRSCFPPVLGGGDSGRFLGLRVVNQMIFKRESDFITYLVTGDRCEFEMDLE